MIGFIVALVLLCAGKRPKRWGDCFYFEVGENWGGLELGIFFIANKGAGSHIKNHEHGHAVQNCWWGVLMPFVICIPSATRYWYREIRTRRGLPNKGAYDDIWFEGQATRLGTQYVRGMGNDGKRLE